MNTQEAMDYLAEQENEVKKNFRAAMSELEEI